MPSAGFEPAIPATKRLQIYSLDRSHRDQFHLVNFSCRNCERLEQRWKYCSFQISVKWQGAIVLKIKICKGGLFRENFDCELPNPLKLSDNCI
jgi:hypothetical protein